MPELLAPGDLVDALAAADTDPDDPVALFVDLSRPHSEPHTLDAVRRSARVIVGVADGVHPGSEALAEVLTFTLVPVDDPHPASVEVADPLAAVARVAEIVCGHPIATSALVALAQQVGLLPLWEGLIAESATYSTLLAGTEFGAWRSATPRKTLAPDGDEPVLIYRTGDHLLLELNRPERRNAYGTGYATHCSRRCRSPPTTRPSRSNCAGAVRRSAVAAILAEFGTAPDPARAHLIRLRHNAGAVLWGMRDRVSAHLHGACIGAGIELPAFAGQVIAAPDTWIALPELSMGLVPGAGGTVSITERIGRWRMAWMALTGEVIEVERAWRWGLVDAISE